MAIADPSLPPSPPEAARLKDALGYAAFLVFFWTVCPAPYAAYAAALARIPVAVCLASVHLGGAFRLGDAEGESAPSVQNIMIAAAMLSGLQALSHWHITDWSNFPGALTTGTGAALAAFAYALPDVSRRVPSLLLGVLVAAVYAAGTVLAANGLLDSAAPARFPTKVVSMRISSGKSHTRYISFAGVPGVDITTVLPVSPSVYGAHNPGDDITLELHPGFFKIPWAELK